MFKLLPTALLAVAAALLAGNAFAEEGEHHPHHDFAKDVDAFHAQLAPVWHARPGAERNRDACAKAGEFGRLARAVRSTDNTRLVAATDAFAAQCQANPAAVEAALTEVHEAFHGLIEFRKPLAAR